MSNVSFTRTRGEDSAARGQTPCPESARERQVRGDFGTGPPSLLSSKGQTRNPRLSVLQNQSRALPRELLGITTTADTDRSSRH